MVTGVFGNISKTSFVKPVIILTAVTFIKKIEKSSPFINFSYKHLLKTKMGLSPDAKERLGVVFEVVKTTFHWGFIPTVLYLGKFFLFDITLLFKLHA